MKTLVVSIFALTMLGAGAASAGGIGVGAHIGGLHLGLGMHGDGRHRHCTGWGRREHHGYCRHWDR